MFLCEVCIEFVFEVFKILILPHKCFLWYEVVIGNSQSHERTMNNNNRNKDSPSKNYSPLQLITGISVSRHQKIQTHMHTS